MPESDAHIGVQFASQVAATLSNSTESIKLSVDEARGMSSQNPNIQNEIELAQPKENEVLVDSQITNETVNLGELPVDDILEQVDYTDGHKELIEKCNLPSIDSYSTIYKSALTQDDVAWNQPIKQECIPAYEEAEVLLQKEAVELKDENSELEDLPITENSSDIRLKHDTLPVREELGSAKGQRVAFILTKEVELPKSVVDENHSISSAVKEETKITEPTVELEPTQPAGIAKTEKNESK